MKCLRFQSVMASFFSVFFPSANIGLFFFYLNEKKKKIFHIFSTDENEKQMKQCQKVSN